jgi:L-ascorbate metabolism protein UlaG (beta-lactamase superfamily)
MKKIFGFIFIPPVLVGIIIYLFYFYPERLGQAPTGGILERIKLSKNFDQARDGFVNRRKDILKSMFKKYSLMDSVIKYFSPTTVGWPKNKILEQRDDLSLFEQDSNAPIYTWFGHSTLLLRVDNKNILIDPVFSDFASPLSFIARRFQAPVYKLEELPKIDIILISHDHYDHLDLDTIKFYEDQDVFFIVPLGVESHLIHWGVDEKKIKSFDWWDEFNYQGIEFICTPAQHMSGRTGFVGDKTLWASWVIKNQNWNLYYSGDSGYDTHFKDIGDKFGPFDMIFIENGQYNERWHAVHLLPNETAKAYKDLKAKRAFPIHWGMFNLSLHHWFDPPLDFYKNCKDCVIDFLPIGQIQSLAQPSIFPSKMYQYLYKFRRKTEH